MEEKKELEEVNNKDLDDETLVFRKPVMSVNNNSRH